MNRAVYRWGRAAGVVWLEDLDQEGAASITNDVERCLRDLQALGVDLDAQPVIYRDTTGRWDRIATRAGRFVGFAPIGAANFEDAVYAIKGAFP